MSENSEHLFKNVIAHAKEYAFIFPSSEIYEGLNAVYDYGQYGVELKNHIKTYWWKAMVQMRENIVGIDSAILMHPNTWKASGHIASFNDPMIDNKDSKKRYRVDQLLEAKIAQYYRTGENNKARQLQESMDNALQSDNKSALKNLIIEHAVVCPVSGTKNWTSVRYFNLMFSSQLGSTTEGASKIYLRPETAQGIFVNFLNVQKTGRMKIPFGIAQIGKAFRNEVVTGQFIMRMREFEQMEMQFFVRPGTETEWYHYWKEARLKWHLALGTPAEKYRYRDHQRMAHYANAAVDIEFEFPFGFKEIEGIHSRMDFDLSQHQQYSGKSLQYFDPEIKQHYLPYVIETSIGLDRMFLLILINAYEEQVLGNHEGNDRRKVLHLHPVLAPIKVAILPLTKKDTLPEKAQAIRDRLQANFHVQYDEKGSIGKRYRRQDAIGTPFCITVDHETLENETVTIRYRDSMEQKRIPIAGLDTMIADLVDWKNLL